MEDKSKGNFICSDCTCKMVLHSVTLVLYDLHAFFREPVNFDSGWAVLIFFDFSGLNVLTMFLNRLIVSLPKDLKWA